MHLEVNMKYLSICNKLWTFSDKPKLKASCNSVTCLRLYIIITRLLMLAWLLYLVICHNWIYCFSFMRNSQKRLLVLLGTWKGDMAWSAHFCHMLDFNRLPIWMYSLGLNVLRGWYYVALLDVVNFSLSIEKTFHKWTYLTTKIYCQQQFLFFKTYFSHQLWSNIFIFKPLFYPTSTFYWIKFQPLFAALFYIK